MGDDGDTTSDLSVVVHGAVYVVENCSGAFVPLRSELGFYVGSVHVGYVSF